jgi:hypothetical protein
VPARLDCLSYLADRRRSVERQAERPGQHVTAAARYHADERPASRVQAHDAVDDLVDRAVPAVHDDQLRGGRRGQLTRVAAVLSPLHV